MVPVRQGFRMTGIKRKQTQHFGERSRGVRHYEVLPGDHQMQTWLVVPVLREFAGTLTVGVDIKA